MSKLSVIDEKKLDDQLAEFADMALSTGEETVMEEINQEVDLQKLQMAVLRMKSAAKSARPKVETGARIRRNLLAEWKDVHQPHHFIDRISVNLRKISGVTLAGGFALALLLGVFLIASPSPDSVPLTGAASGSPDWVPFVVITGIILFFVFFWFTRRR
jgi:hypothetical protein